MARRSGHSNRRGSGDDAGLVLLLAVLEGLLFWWVGKGIFGAAKKGHRRLRAAAEAESLPAPSTPYKTALDNRYAWRLNCEDGSAYGIRPEDYETRAAYNAALASAKSASGLGHVRSKAGAGHGPTDAGQDSFTPASLVCRVSLLSNGKTETFRLGDPAIKVGDVISVTVDGKADQGVVVAIEDGPRVVVRPATRAEAEPPRFDDFSEFFDGETPGDEEDKTDPAPAPIYSPQVSEEPVKRADVHKHIQPAPKKRMSAGTATFLAILTVAFIGFLAYGIVTSMKESQKKETALQDCEQQAIAVCERYGLQNVSANAAFRQTQYILYCDLTASADGVSDLEFQDQYELMKKLEEIEVEYEHWAVMKTKLTSGGSEYCLNPDDEYTLQIDGQDAYVDLFEADRRFRAELRYDEIYVGLEERYIDSSWYGRHDHVEYCEGFNDLPPQERTVTYSWDYPNGDTRIEAVVGYWDDETGEETDGKIIEIIHHDIPYEYVQKVMATPKPTPKRSYSSSKAKDAPSDPYDVYDYSDPDDFYYDHYDDFFDYEDAEDYFYEHDD